MKNTRFLYQYRDTANYKTIHEIIFAGAITEAECRSLTENLDPCDGDALGDFIPGQIGLKDLQASFYEHPVKVAEFLSNAGGTESEGVADLLRSMRKTKPLWWPDDGPFHELLMIDHVSQDPTDPRPVSEIAKIISNAKWDGDYRPPFHAEMVKNYNEYMSSQEDPEP